MANWVIRRKSDGLYWGKSGSGAMIGEWHPLHEGTLKWTQEMYEQERVDALSEGGREASSFSARTPSEWVELDDAGQPVEAAKPVRMWVLRGPAGNYLPKACTAWTHDVAAAFLYSSDKDYPSNVMVPVLVHPDGTVTLDEPAPAEPQAKPAYSGPLHGLPRDVVERMVAGPPTFEAAKPVRMWVVGLGGEYYGKGDSLTGDLSSAVRYPCEQTLVFLPGHNVPVLVYADGTVTLDEPAPKRAPVRMWVVRRGTDYWQAGLRPWTPYVARAIRFNEQPKLSLPFEPVAVLVHPDETSLPTVTIDGPLFHIVQRPPLFGGKPAFFVGARMAAGLPWRNTGYIDDPGKASSMTRDEAFETAKAYGGTVLAWYFDGTTYPCSEPSPRPYIGPDALNAYVLRHGWTELPARSGLVRRYMLQRAGAEITMITPATFDGHDYEQAVERALELMSRVEKRSVSDIVEEILGTKKETAAAEAPPTIVATEVTFGWVDRLRILLGRKLHVRTELAPGGAVLSSHSWVEHPADQGIAMQAQERVR